MRLTPTRESLRGCRRTGTKPSPRRRRWSGPPSPDRRLASEPFESFQRPEAAVFSPGLGRPAASQPSRRAVIRRRRPGRGPGSRVPEAPGRCRAPRARWGRGWFSGSSNALQHERPASPTRKTTGNTLAHLPRSSRLTREENAARASDCAICSRFNLSCAEYR